MAGIEIPKSICTMGDQRIEFNNEGAVLSWPCATGPDQQCQAVYKPNGTVDSYNGEPVTKQPGLNTANLNWMLRNARTEARAFYDLAKRALEGKGGLLTKKGFFIGDDDELQPDSRHYVVSDPKNSFFAFGIIFGRANEDEKIRSVYIYAHSCSFNTYNVSDASMFGDTTALSAIIFKDRAPLENIKRACEKSFPNKCKTTFDGFDRCADQLKAGVKKMLLEGKKDCADDKTCDELAQKIGTEKGAESWKPTFEASAKAFWTQECAPKPPAPAPAAPAAPAPAPPPVGDWGD